MIPVSCTVLVLRLADWQGVKQLSFPMFVLPSLTKHQVWWKSATCIWVISRWIHYWFRKSQFFQRILQSNIVCRHKQHLLMSWKSVACYRHQIIRGRENRNKPAVRIISTEKILNLHATHNSDLHKKDAATWRSSKWWIKVHSEVHPVQIKSKSLDWMGVDPTGWVWIQKDDHYTLFCKSDTTSATHFRNFKPSVLFVVKLTKSQDRFQNKDIQIEETSNQISAWNLLKKPKTKQVYQGLLDTRLVSHVKRAHI